MNLKKQNDLFEKKYLSKTDNVFEAVNMLSQDAYAIYHTYEGKLLKSECLTCAITGRLPENISKRKTLLEIEATYRSKYIREALCEIDDIDVRKSVFVTLNTSIENKFLSYRYLSGMSDGQKARVKVISNMIWYNLYQEKGE